jgi:hypothetical protein
VHLSASIVHPALAASRDQRYAKVMSQPFAETDCSKALQ